MGKGQREGDPGSSNSEYTGQAVTRQDPSWQRVWQPGRGNCLGRRQGREREDKGGCKVDGVRLGKNLEAIFKNFVLNMEKEPGRVWSRWVEISCQERGPWVLQSQGEAVRENIRSSVELLLWVRHWAKPFWTHSLYKWWKLRLTEGKGHVQGLRIVKRQKLGLKPS